VSLARAAYAELFTEKADAKIGKATHGLVVLDDPLSALDAGTAKLVFKRLLKGRSALFSNAAVVLVTHASHFLSQVDKVVVIVDGTNHFTGSWADLLRFEAADAKVVQFIEFIRLSVQEEEHCANDEDLISNEKLSQIHDAVADNLMKKEEREYGVASTSTWLLWFKHAGGFFFMSFQVIFMAIDRVAYVAVEYWLARWTNGAEMSITAFGIVFPPQTDGRDAQYRYLTVFSVLIVASVLGTIVRSLWAVTGGARAAKNVFTAMLVRILGAPMCYFESTPQGRLLNRFTYDMVRICSWEVNRLL
jgi:ABC-type multidrug transport system fused ATPase/permease subunit